MSMTLFHTVTQSRTSPKIVPVVGNCNILTVSNTDATNAAYVYIPGIHGNGAPGTNDFQFVGPGESKTYRAQGGPIGAVYLANGGSNATVTLDPTMADASAASYPPSGPGPLLLTVEPSSSTVPSGTIPVSYAGAGTGSANVTYSATPATFIANLRNAVPAAHFDIRALDQRRFLITPIGAQARLPFSLTAGPATGGGTVRLDAVSPAALAAMLN